MDIHKLPAQTGLRRPEVLPVGNLFIPLLLAALLNGGFTATVAASKGYNATEWFFSGLVFGPLALLATLGLPDLKLRGYIRLLAEHQGALSSPPSSASDWEKGSEDWEPGAYS